MNSFKFFLSAVSALALAPFVFGQSPAESENPDTEKVSVVSVEEAEVAGNAEAASVPAEEAKDPSAPAQVTPPVPVPPPVPELTPEQRKQMEVRLLSARKARIDAEMALARARLSEQLAPRAAERARMEAETALRVARNNAKFSDIEAEKRKLDAALSLEKARDDLAILERGNALRAADLDFKIERAKQELTLAQRNREIAQVQMAEKLRTVAPAAAFAPENYLKEPLADGKLYISDRRIELNDVIMPELANYVTERIYFYNNQSTEYPIFIVIDSSPGGSVAAGYQILKAMESSKAPVYVVVKSYAASMAAMITTAAERSFCYKDTVIMQHQPSSGTQGNLRQMAEQLESVVEWTRNINDKLAAKMGLTYEEYVAEMYKHNSQGDWTEFGDGAKKWNWVSDIVDTIDETAFVRKEPEAKRPKMQTLIIRQQKIDEQGRPYFDLPTLPAGDAWMIYDPNNLYRAAAR